MHFFPVSDGQETKPVQTVIPPSDISKAPPVFVISTLKFVVAIGEENYEMKYTGCRKVFKHKYIFNIFTSESIK